MLRTRFLERGGEHSFSSLARHATRPFVVVRYDRSPSRPIGVTWAVLPCVCTCVSPQKQRRAIHICNLLLLATRYRTKQITFDVPSVWAIFKRSRIGFWDWYVVRLHTWSGPGCMGGLRDSDRNRLIRQEVSFITTTDPCAPSNTGKK